MVYQKETLRKVVVENQSFISYTDRGEQPSDQQVLSYRETSHYFVDYVTVLSNLW